MKQIRLPGYTSWLFIALVATFSVNVLHCTPPPPVEEPGLEKKQDEKVAEETPLVDGGVVLESRPEPAEPDAVPEVDPDTKVPDIPEPIDVIPRPTTGWCSRAAAGSPGQQKAMLALSKAHAHIRFLGIHKGYPSIDGTLAKVLAQHAINEPKLLQVYADGLESVCALSANTETLPKASLVMQGDVAVIRPGAGELTLPKEAKAIAIDLRKLPDVSGLLSALHRAVGLALAQNTKISQENVRIHKGLTDEYFSMANNSYSNQVRVVEQLALLGASQTPLPLVFIVGDTIAPAAAELAGSLRLSGRAWLLGKPIPAAVAESRWLSVGRAGFVFRVKTLYHDGAPWPDFIPADKPVADLDAFLKVLPQQASAPKISGFQAQREDMRAYVYFRQFHREKPTKANVTAALLIAHGALRAFFPYFKTVGDTIDARLEEVIGAVEKLASDSISGIQSRWFLRRFGESIKDGHNFVYSIHTGSEYTGYMLATLDQLQGKPVVVRSAVQGLLPGDTIDTIDGMPAADWFNREYKRTSAASPGYRFDLAARELLLMVNPMVLKVTSAEGKQKDVQVTPQGYKAYEAFLQSAKPKRAGFLTSLGAPDIYYINLDNASIQLEDLSQILKDAQSAKGIVLDMRGYPGPKAWELITYLVDKPLPSPWFRTFSWSGPNKKSVSQTDYSFQPKTPHLSAPAVYLTGPRTVSAAEHLGTMLKQANRVTFMGRTSAGTNGSITGLILPGGLIFLFTGMEVLWRDKTTFHGIGLRPASEFEPTPQDIAAGKDPLLVKAITHLQK